MMEILKKVVSIFIGLGLISILGVASSWSAENEPTTLTCIFDGYGKTSPTGNPMKVKLEQRVKFNDYGVSSITHNFITDYKFHEGWASADGLKYQWLEYESEVTDDEIRVTSKNSGNPKKGESVNIKYYWYSVDLVVSRKTGIGTREMNLMFDINFDTPNVVSHQFDYQVSGDCKVLGNKF